MRLCRVSLAIVALASSLASGGASTLFFDGFDAENGGVTSENYASFSNWAVVEGSVDLIGPGLADLYPGNGLYVDLDGTSEAAATLESTALISLAPGAYSFSFDLGDTNFLPTAPPAPNELSVTLFEAGGGVLTTTTFTSADTVAMTLLRQTFTFDVASPTSLTIRFEQTTPSAGGDNHGLVIDNVLVALVPAPGAMIALPLGCGLLTSRRR